MGLHAAVCSCALYSDFHELSFDISADNPDIPWFATSLYLAFMLCVLLFDVIEKAAWWGRSYNRRCGIFFSFLGTISLLLAVSLSGIWLLTSHLRFKGLLMSEIVMYICSGYFVISLSSLFWICCCFRCCYD